MDDAPNNETLAENIYKQWSPKSIIVTASGEDIDPSLSLGKKFDLTDIEGIIEYLNNNGIYVGIEELSEYDISSISFTETGSITIRFKDSDKTPFTGTFTLDDKIENGISYDFDLSSIDNTLPIISGTAILTITGNKLSIYTERDFDYMESVYHISLTIICEECN